MLHIYYGDMDDVIFNTSVYFKNVYQDEWITDQLSVKMIEDIDKSKVLARGAIDSLILGVIPPVSLSGGVKTLILIKNRSDKVFNATNCGDNCAKWLLKLAEADEITINLRYLMDFAEETFNIKVLNNGKIVNSMEELIPVAMEYV